MSPLRRDFLRTLALAAASSALPGCSRSGKGRAHVVVVGGGFGGATAAKYLRMWSEGSIEVTLVERGTAFVSCPLSNLVLSGHRELSRLTLGYEGLRNWGVRVVHDEVEAVDAEKRRIRLARNGVMSYDRLILSPGVDFMHEQIPALNSAAAQSSILHAWKAGAQTEALRRQLVEMKDGGVFALCVPKAPYRCPPGPYERASVIAAYFKAHKPKSKVLVLDANQEIVSKKALFEQAWAELYPGIIEYRPNCELRDVAVPTRTAILDFERVDADVLNVIPPQRAGDIALRAGLRLINDRWVDIDWLSMESTSTPGIHVLGDAIFPAPTMPKSGHIANQHAKLAAAAILDLLAGRTPNPTPLVMNTCYSFVSATEAIHVASIHRYDNARKTVLPVPGSGGVSAARSELEGVTANGWAQNIWADMLA